jgi:hypothetical protein
MMLAREAGWADSGVPETHISRITRVLAMFILFNRSKSERLTASFTTRQGEGGRKFRSPMGISERASLNLR